VSGGIDPEQRLVLAMLRRTFGQVDVLPTRWEWRAVPFGRCLRCQWPANTLGPDEWPWHPFCWGYDEPVPAYSEWLRRKVEAGEWGQR
jgi:hypothetical protein